jgi:hypothetical protein
VSVVHSIHPMIGHAHPCILVLSYPHIVDTKSLLLYSVFAYDSPASSVPAHVADMRIAEPFVRSIFADTQLFFQHTRMDDDYAIHPEWLQYDSKL